MFQIEIPRCICIQRTTHPKPGGGVVVVVVLGGLGRDRRPQPNTIIDEKRSI